MSLTPLYRTVFFYGLGFEGWNTVLVFRESPTHSDGVITLKSFYFLDPTVALLAMV